ncbi:Aerobic glycerol-3-phosphate dehydrogenase [Fagus crenata]
MASIAALAARQAATLTRLSSPKTSAPAAHLIQRRGLAGAADHHGPPRVNVWQDPMSPSKWKEEHFVIVSLTGWGLLIFSGYKFFTGGKGKKEEVTEPHHGGL